MGDHGCRRSALSALVHEHDEIAALAAGVRDSLAGGHHSGARRLLGVLREAFAAHAAWEEAGLFVRMTRQSDFAEYVSCLEAEHAGLAAQFTLADGDRAGWADEVLDLLDEIDQHVRDEEHGLFPAAISVLDPADWAAIVAARPTGRDVAAVPGGVTASAVLAGAPR